MSSRKPGCRATSIQNTTVYFWYCLHSHWGCTKFAGLSTAAPGHDWPWVVWAIVRLPVDMFQTHDASCLSCHHGPHARPCGFKDSNHLNPVFLFKFFLSIEPGKVLASVSIHHDMVTMCHIESQYYHWTLSSGQVTHKEIRKIGTAEQLWEQQWLSGLQHIKSPNWLWQTVK